MLRIAVLVSGGGTNLQAIIDGVEQGKITNTEICCVISNNPGAYALKRAEKHKIEGVCISPNDVPGYDKDKYMPEKMKDENGKAYAYRDRTGNYYEMDFGLSY